MTNRSLAFGLFLLAMLMLPFTNCSSYSNTSNVTGLSSVSCLNATCVNPDPTLLKITVNTADGGGYGVTAGLSEFNLGGDCNEGGSPYNQVHWELYDMSSTTNTAVRNSSMPVAAGSSADSKCVNGRFMLYVSLASVTGDANNRTGLLSPITGVRGAYMLKVWLYGRTAPNDTNTILSAFASVQLSAI